MVTSASASHKSSRSKLDATSESFYHLSEQTSWTSGSELLPDISSAMDDTYDPPFLNYVRIQDHGRRNNVRHFVEKHRADGLTRSTIRHWVVHFEFGSCLLDSSQLKSRYTALRELDDQMSTRFIQIYTTCHKPRGRHHRRTDEKTTEFSHCGDRQDSYALHRIGPKQGAIFECRANAIIRINSWKRSCSFARLRISRTVGSIRFGRTSSLTRATRLPLIRVFSIQAVTMEDWSVRSAMFSLSGCSIAWPNLNFQTA
jgi:hypothetical protein